MGLIRKTLSVGTLGIIPFRSRKEKLRRAERSRRDAELALDREKAARVAAEGRVSAAEKRVKHATAEALHAAKRLERVKRRRRVRRAEKLGLIAGVEAARMVGSDAAERGRRAGRRARKAAKRSARDARKVTRRSLRGARAAAASTREAVAPRLEKVAAKAGEVISPH